MICEYTAAKFCKDDLSKIENYALAIADTTETWSCHHRLELTHDNEFAHTAEELKRLDMYYNRPYYELIFLRASYHHTLHNMSRPRQWYIDAGKKVSKAKKGCQTWNKGIPCSDATKSKLSAAMQGARNPMYGKHWKLVDGKRVWY